MENEPSTSGLTGKPDASVAQVRRLSQLSKALSGEKQFLRSVLDSLEDAIVAFDPQGTFVLCNRKFETLFQLSATELTGHDEPWLRQCLRERLEAPDNFWKPVGDRMATREEVVRLLDKRRSNKPYVLNWHWGPVLDENGELAGHIAVQRDITRETEVDQMKTDFISIVSHELRTPMTSIRGYVDLILDGDTGEINDLQRQFLKTVQRNTLRLTAMVNDMLDISRIEDGGIELDLRDLSLDDVITQVVSEARPQIEKKGLSISIVSHDEAGQKIAMPRVRSDHDRLMQVVTNLLSNAVKYTPAPPESAGQITIEIRTGEEQARVGFRDTGIGISEEDIANLFQKFFRANNPATRDVDGTGLGLSITRALIEKMGGELQVQSKPGEGSEFAFSLPLAGRPKQAVKVAPVQVTTQSSLLIATTRADSAAAEKKVWAGMSDDIAISSAYSGAEAIRYLDSMVTEAVMLDMLMPYGDAFHVLRFLGSHQNGMTVAPLQSIRRPGSASKIEQPWFATLPLEDKTVLRADLQALLGRKAKKVEQQAVVVRGPETLSPTTAKKTVGRALEALGLSIVRLNNTAEALAAVRENSGKIATLVIDLTLESDNADEQTLQLIETLGSEAFNNRHNLPMVLLICEGYLLVCAWPEEDSFQHQHFQELVDRDRHRIWLALQMAN